MSGIKRDKYDKLFSDLIREANDYTCERCGLNFRHKTQGLHASHFYGRRYQATRYHPWNVSAHCYGCHQYFGENPKEHVRWFEGERSGLRAYKLTKLVREPWKWQPGEKEYMYAHYKGEMNRVLHDRNEGFQGTIEIEPYSRKLFTKALEMGYAPKIKKRKKRKNKK